MNRHTLLYICCLLAACLMAGCGRQRVYDHYEHVPVSGWERNDTLIFDLPAMTKTSQYAESVGVRINSEYPFMSLSLIVEQTVYPSLLTHSDTVSCSLIDRLGNPKGNGISAYQYLFPFRALQIKEGESLRIAVRHDMKREILPGITDIGIQVSYESASDWRPNARR